MRKAIDLDQVLSVEQQAARIAEMYLSWKTQRKEWEDKKRELAQYVYQTDTTQTRNAKLPWQNTTTRPKLCQIRDNLHANYFSALALESQFLKWEGRTRDDAIRMKAEVMTAYCLTKFRESKGEDIVEQLLYDYIDYGIAISGVEYVTEWIVDEVTGDRTVTYSGPRMLRYNPNDVLWDMTAASFDDAAKITRTVVSLGQLHRLARDYPEYQYDVTKVAGLGDTRHKFAGLSAHEIKNIDSARMAGIGDLSTYFNSGMVELLTFEGDYYDVTSNTMYENHTIVVADRCTIISKRQNPSWLGKSSKRAAMWRPRPDNLMPMGPLDNLVGMQYRIDHLQNMKADAMDQIVYPRKKIKGFVQDFSDEPGETIYCGEDGDVSYLQPDLSFLQVDNEIVGLENAMEEFAGAPKTALGIRTPGEKTAYEVQQLENAAGRIFQVKIRQFERQLLEPILNLMLESGRRNLDNSTVVRHIDDNSGATIYTTVDRTDLTTQGMIQPQGARHFAERAKLVQEVTQFFGSPIGADQGVRVHFSGKQIAKLFNEALNFGSYNLYRENAQIDETLETQSYQETATQEAQGAQQIPSPLAGEAIELTEELAMMEGAPDESV